MKRYLALLLACLMVISLFAGCSSKEETTEEASTTETATEEGTEEAGDETEEEATTEESGVPMSANGEVPIVEEMMEFTVNCRQVSNVMDMPTNEFVLWLEKVTNIHINYEMTPEDSISEKTNLILASGEYPDGFQYSSINTTLQVKYGAQGAFVNMAPLLEKYGKYINEAYDAVDYLPKAITTPTGEMYCIAGVNECYHCFHAGRAWINKIWLDDLGLEVPDTLDELRTVLEAFRDNDCNGNGDNADEVPMIGTAYDNGTWNGSSSDWLLESFLYSDYDMLTAVKDGHVIYQGTTEEYKEGLKTIRDFVADGLLDNEYLSITGDELSAIGMQEDPRIGLLIAALWWAGVGNGQITDANGIYRDRNYVAQPNVVGPTGERNTLSATEGIGGNFVMTSACEYPEVLFRWVDYQMCDEASIRAYAGSYESNLSEPDEGAVGIDQNPALYKIAGNSDHADADTNINCDNVAISNKCGRIRLGQQTDWDDPEAYYDSEARLYCDTRDFYAPYDCTDKRVPTLVMGEEDANIRSEMETPIRDYRRQWLGDFTLGNADIDGDWDNYIGGYDGLRLQEYIDLLDEYYQIEYVNA